MSNNFDLGAITHAIANYSDFPKPGIMFKDLSPVFANSGLFSQLINAFCYSTERLGHFDYIAGIEARGFIIGAAAAASLGIGFIPIRKKGKLPGQTLQKTYTLEYGTDILEIQAAPEYAKKRVLIADDVFATGGTLKAAISLFNEIGCQTAAGVLLDIGINNFASIEVPGFVLL